MLGGSRGLFVFFSLFQKYIQNLSLCAFVCLDHGKKVEWCPIWSEETSSRELKDQLLAPPVALCGGRGQYEHVFLCAVKELPNSSRFPSSSGSCFKPNHIYLLSYLGRCSGVSVCLSWLPSKEKFFFLFPFQLLYTRDNL